jgi:hypothetical protein
MALVHFEAEDRYEVGANKSMITVFAEFGDGQPGGGYVVFLNQELKGVNEESRMGNPAQVKGKWMIVSATIIDKLEETNWTSLIVTVKQGNNSRTYGPYSKQVPAHLDSVVFLIKIYAE